MKTIIIDFKPDGQTMVLTQGYAGPACIKATEFLIDTLGPVERRMLTPEYQKVEAPNATVHAVHQTGR